MVNILKIKILYFKIFKSFSYQNHPDHLDHPGHQDYPDAISIILYYFFHILTKF